MFITNAITVWVEALRMLFDSDYVDPELRDIRIGTDYPQEQVEYPSIWVNFVANGTVSNAGIGHAELTEITVGSTTETHEFFRWTFAGHVEFVVSTMGNLERALILDEIAKAIAVGRVDENDYGVLRNHVQTSDLVGMVASWESFEIGGFGETIGTPWGTDDVLYEASISIPVEGECILDPSTNALVPLTAVNIAALGPGDGDPPTPGPGVGPGVWV